MAAVQEVAESTSSSITSTSHTLTNAPFIPATIGAMATSTDKTSLNSNEKPPLALFLDSITPENRHVFLQPSSNLPTGSLFMAKETLDALAGLVSDTQAERFKQLMGKKRKREAGYDRASVLKIRKVHVDGFETGQVWQQAKKIIGCALEESDILLDELLEGGEVVEEGQENGVVEEEEEGVKMVRFDEDGFEIDSEDEAGSASSDSDEGSQGDSEDTDEESEEELSDEEEVDGQVFDEEEEEGLEVDGEEDEEEEDEEEDEDEEASEEFEEDPDGLNDGFFSLKKFNKQTQWFEAQDARADPNTDVQSDDESLDWHADPFSAPKGNGEGPMEDEDDSDVDLNGEEFDQEDDEGEEEEEIPAEKLKKSKKGKITELEDDGDDLGLGEMDMDFSANDIYYKDFFAPPPQKGKRGGKKKEFKFREQAKPDENDFERAERDVRRDLFDDDSERDDSDDALSDASAGDPRSRRSAHERRQAKIAEEIRKLESELVAKRAWTLAGEASAVDRPMNSLLEEDLDFEHVGKPVPVITEEVSESIEALIKRRILAQEFDELLRRRPDTLGDPNRARRGLVEVEDTKGKQSLAEIYEEEYAKKEDPDAYVSKSDEKLRKDEEEIKQMWKDVSARLDALSSWQYKPKPAAPTLTVVSDVATVAMEDAQPTTAQGVTGGESMIAPQEVYAPGKENAERGEVVAKSGLPIARQEMSREEKIRRRRREKERIRKAGGVDANKPMSRGTQARKETMADLKKGGVKVINRKGETVGLDGKKVVEQTGVTSSSRFKL
ncbi:putative U3 small nucleolar ribonucleoprotein [Rhypophila decipiens]|uniref:U3 small nucleolar ribonucleoprotein n=1 Tax=Rhypophila decipiens TaxID=261697 RepID=A0AAN6YDN1_9PEZI|nr:putative U3 small nucleolar ribonucleoprotein [Rhypophila decipiens]